jgi:hypothetical protein
MTPNQQQQEGELEVPGAMPLYHQLLPLMQHDESSSSSRSTATAAKDQKAASRPPPAAAVAPGGPAGGSLPNNSGEVGGSQGPQQGFSQLHHEVVAFARHCLPTEQQLLVVQKAMEVLQRVARSCWSNGDAIMFGSQVSRPNNPGLEV